MKELTRPEEGKRLPIAQFQRLLPFIDQFYSCLVKKFPSDTLGIAQDLELESKTTHSR